LKSFRQALMGGAFTVTADLCLQPGMSTDEFLRRARIVANHVHGIHLAETSGAGARISPVAVSTLLLREGIDALPGLHCRDRNRIALQSDLLGLRASGVRSLVLSTGRPFDDNRRASAKAVYDLQVNGLLAMAQSLNEEETSSVERELLLGTSAPVSASPRAALTADLRQRAEAGARFLISSPCSDAIELKDYVSWLVDERITWHYSVILGVAPEQGADAVSPALIRACAELPGVSGINLLCPGEPEALIAAIEAAGLPASE
jgi:methylenetetrahydrofolate reductase (NADPH)